MVAASGLLAHRVNAKVRARDRLTPTPVVTACASTRTSVRRTPGAAFDEHAAAWRAAELRDDAHPSPFSHVSSITSRKMRLTHPSNRPATVALWLAVFATCVSLLEPQFGAFLLGMPLGLGAVVFGIIGIVRTSKAGGRSLATIGLVLGLVGPIAAVGVWLLIIEVFDIPCC
jgi:hypothetical protein